MKDNAKKQRFVGKVQVIEVEIVFKCQKKQLPVEEREKNSSRGLELHIFQNPTMFNGFVYIESFGGGKKVYLKKYSIAVLLKMSGYILSHDCFNSFLWQSKKLFKK